MAEVMFRNSYVDAVFCFSLLKPALFQMYSKCFYFWSSRVQGSRISTTHYVPAKSFVEEIDLKNQKIIKMFPILVDQTLMKLIDTHLCFGFRLQ